MKTEPEAGEKERAEDTVDLPPRSPSEPPPEEDEEARQDEKREEDRPAVGRISKKKLVLCSFRNNTLIFLLLKYGLNADTTMYAECRCLMI